MAPSDVGNYRGFLGDNMAHADWKGWIWLAGRWHFAAKGVSLDACSRALTKAADEEGVKDSDCVMTKGGVPVGMPLGRCSRRDTAR